MSTISSVASELVASAAAPASQAIGEAVLGTVNNLAQDQVNRLFASFGVGHNVNGQA